MNERIRYRQWFIDHWWHWGMTKDDEAGFIGPLREIKDGIFYESFQSTGLHDSKGVEIFEGDIVHYLYQPGRGFWNFDDRSVISWNSTGFYMKPIKDGGFRGWLISAPGLGASPKPNKLLTVIGNTKENPDMMEARK